MKSTENFKKVIEQHLQGAASVNELFAEKLKNPKKNIDDCITYILNQVKRSGASGFEDTEIFGMAMHYYDEDNLEVGKQIPQAQVAINRVMELTEEEKEELRKKARQQVIDEEKQKLRKKPAKSTASSKDDKKESNTLFD